MMWSSAGAAELPPGEALLGPEGAFRLTGQTDAVALSAVSDGRAWRIETRRDLSPTWAVEWKAAIPRDVARGDVGLIRFRARAVMTSNEAGTGHLRLAVQKASPDWAKSAEAELTADAQWRDFALPFAFRDDYAAGTAEVSFGFGFRRQTLEIADLQVLYFGRNVELAALPRTRFDYHGRESGAPWREAALARIETLRRGDGEVRVVDAQGRPVPGAAVSVEQVRSAFHFGSALVMRLLVEDTPDAHAYRAKVRELFNAGGPENDLKWPPWIGEWGAAYRREQTLAGLQWMRENELHARGHVLVWPGWKNLPAAMRQLRDSPQQSEIPARVLAHIADIVSATRDWLDEWDVVNEPWDNHDLMDLFGEAIMVDWFRAARMAHPTARLYLNDYGNHDRSRRAGKVAHFEATARRLLEWGAPLDGLGVQGHFGANPSAPTEILATFDRYAVLGLPIRITEFDVNTDDEELQADFTRDFLILCYSHPAVVGVQLWGFWEGAHWIPRAALYRRDWSEKPNGRVWRQLVTQTWRTRDSGNTDAHGVWSFRGYQGDYRVTVEQGGRQVVAELSLPPGTVLPAVVQVALPAAP
jgi:endo-1,4-beta-xylanase